MSSGDGQREKAQWITQLASVIDGRIRRLAQPKPGIGVVAGQKNADGTVDVRIAGNPDTQPCYRSSSYEPQAGHRVIVVHGDGWKFVHPDIAGHGQ